MMVPFAFLLGLLRMRLTRAGAVSELVARLSAAICRRRGLRDALADALGDPRLALAYWIPARGMYVSAAGLPVDLPEIPAPTAWPRSCKTTARPWPRSFTTPRWRTSAS